MDNHAKGIELFRVIWEGYSAEAATWEPADNIEPETLSQYKESMRREAEADAAAEAELEDDSDDEGDDGGDDGGDEDSSDEEEALIGRK